MRLSSCHFRNESHSIKENKIHLIAMSCEILQSGGKVNLLARGKVEISSASLLL
jgi:hypothetical protein